MENNVALTATGIVKRYGKRLVLDGAELVLRRSEVSPVKLRRRRRPAPVLLLIYVKVGAFLVC